MGDFIGGIIGGIGAGKAQEAATGELRNNQARAEGIYNQQIGVVNSNKALNSAQANGVAAGNNESALLGLGGNTAAAQSAFNKYLGSTGYNFQLGQGQNAISSSAAARGLLNSGATAKALTQYGQNLASTSFQTYLGNLGGLNSAGLGAAQTQIGATSALAGNEAAMENQNGQALAQIASDGINGQYQQYGAAAKSLTNSFMGMV